MMSNNYRRKVDNRGRLVIPANIRDVFAVSGATVEVFTENDLICIRKCQTRVPVSAASPSSRQLDDAPVDSVKPRKTLTGTSACNRCICSSCNGFGCPWIPQFSRYAIHRVMSERCWVCHARNWERIHDCDFYTARKRVKFYVKRKAVFKETKLDKLMKQVGELKKMLDKGGKQ